MLQAMFNGVSAIEAHQQRMDVIGNNIANVDTTAYKAGRVTFQDQLSQTLQGASAGNANVGGTNPVQTGLGVRVGTIDTIQTQGGLQSTSKPTDMAIQGNGYFMLGSASGISYTRDGSFSIDNSGNLVNAADGSYVLGWAADTTGKVDHTKEITPASHLSIPVGGLQATAPSTLITYGGNLSADTTAASTALNPYTRTVKVYDSLGAPQNVTLGFTRNADPQPAAATAAATTGGTLPAGTYYVGYSYLNASGETVSSAPQSVTTTATNNAISVNAGTLPAGATNIKVYTGTSANALSFAGQSAAASGSYTVASLPGAGAAPPPASTWTWTASGPAIAGTPSGTTNTGVITFSANGAEVGSTGVVQLTNTDKSATPQNITPDFTKVGQVSGSSSAAATGTDGYAPGTLQSFTVDETGTVSGIFTNGYTRTLGQVALTDFANPEGLQRNGGNAFTGTVNSGLPQVGAATDGSFGKISTGYLEQSNVDLSNEFTNMIITQRGFQANTKIVTTVDSMLNEIINIKQ